MTALILSLGFGMMTIIDLPALIKKRDMRGILIYGILLSAAYTLSLVQVLDIHIPNPSDIIKIVVKSLVHINFTFTQ